MREGKKRRIKLGKRAAAFLDIPRETLTGEVKLTLYGDSMLVAENHSGVFECTQGCIRLRTGSGLLRIEGRDMTLMELTDERALIEGSITAAVFEHLGK